VPYLHQCRYFRNTKHLCHRNPMAPSCTTYSVPVACDCNPRLVWNRCPADAIHPFQFILIAVSVDTHVIVEPIQLVTSIEKIAFASATIPRLLASRKAGNSPSKQWGILPSAAPDESLLQGLIERCGAERLHKRVPTPSPNANDRVLAPQTKGKTLFPPHEIDGEVYEYDAIRATRSKPPKHPEQMSLQCWRSPRLFQYLRRTFRN